MKGLNFSLKPHIEINEIKKLLIKFKKNKNYKKKNIYWDYFLNPFGKTKFFIAHYNGLIIGMLICLKQIYINKNQKYSGYRIQDVITDTEMIKKLIKDKKKLITKNKKGIFDNLIIRLNKFISKNSKLNLGFANHLAFPFWKRNGWKNISEFPLYEKKLFSKEKINLKPKIIKNFNLDHEKIFLRNLTKKINIFWSAKYSNWRYINNPRSKYFVYEFFLRNKLVGYTVLKEYFLDTEKKGHICQIVSAPKFKREIINFANNFFLKKKIQNLSLWSFDTKLMKKKDFKKNYSINKKIVYSGYLNLKKQNIDINMGFSDIY